MRLVKLVFLVPAAYQLLAIAAGVNQVWQQRRRRSSKPVGKPFQPGVSVLKPLRGLDPNTEDALLSQVQQDYPRFEVLFGVRDESDPAVPVVRTLQSQHPHVPIKLVIGAPDLPNAKVGTLSVLAQHARHPVWVVNDGDIRVDNQYLSSVVAPLENSAVGIVTCPYRAMAHTASAAWESLGITTDFMPSTFVAQMLGVREFGLGSTLVFRAADLQEAGGFVAISLYLADDYQLAKRITGLGKRAVLLPYVVETSLGEDSWSGVWRHQLRWARTIRSSKGAAYAGLPITHAGLWATAAMASGAFRPAWMLIGLRMLSAILFSRFILRHRMASLLFWLTPAWDLYAFAVWGTSYFGRTVRWRDKTLEIDSEGRIRT
ncbi:MAG: glycosyltransferase [Bryobacteraceae bacterium]